MSDSHRFIRLADRLLSRLSRPEELAASDEDIYLSPHCDDIAFSIGCFARARGKGRLVTVFTRSNFTLQSGLGDLSVDQVTALRAQEEQRFAARTGLTLIDLGLPEAPLRGFQAMDPSPASQQVPVIGPQFLPKLLALGRAQRRSRRPWLFVPMALGGHLDHAIVLKAILGHGRALRRFFRLAFYEDLPYAAWINERSNGLAMFHRLRPCWAGGAWCSRSAVGLAKSWNSLGSMRASIAPPPTSRRLRQNAGQRCRPMKPSGFGAGPEL